LPKSTDEHMIGRLKSTRSLSNLEVAMEKKSPSLKEQAQQIRKEHLQKSHNELVSDHTPPVQVQSAQEDSKIFRDHEERRIFWLWALVSIIAWYAFWTPAWLLGIATLTIGHWLILRYRFDKMGGWLLVTPVGLLLGTVLSESFSGLLQDWMDDVPPGPWGMAALDPARGSLSYLVSGTFAGAVMGFCLGLGQWLCLRAKTLGAGRWLLGSVGGLTLGGAFHAATIVVIQRTWVGPLLSGVIAATLVVLGGDGGSSTFSNSVNTIGGGVTLVTAAVMRGAAYGAVTGTILIYCLRHSVSKITPE